MDLLLLPADVQQALTFLEEQALTGATPEKRRAAMIVLQLMRDEITHDKSHPPRVEPPHRDRRYFNG